MNTSLFVKISSNKRFVLPSLISFLLIISIFSREIGKISLFGIDYDLISYTFFILIFISLIITFKLKFDKYLIIIFSVLLTGGIFSKFYLGLKILPFFKQFIPIFIIFSSTNYIIRLYGIEKLFQLYVRICFFTALFGLLQYVLGFFDIYILQSIHWHKIDSVAEEPSHYAAILLPATIYTLQRIKTYRLEFYVFLLVLFLTFNLTAYVVFALMFLILKKQLKVLMFSVPAMVLFSNYLYQNDEGFYLRVSSFLNFFETNDLTNIQGTPLSFISNMEVAVNNIKANPLFGAGLGGHEEMYYKYFSLNKFSDLNYLFGLNAKSGHSLAIRVLSETGIVGGILYVYSLLRVFWIRRTSMNFVIGVSAFSHFLCKFLKLGNYFDLGTPFFFLVILHCYSGEINCK